MISESLQDFILHMAETGPVDFYWTKFPGKKVNHQTGENIPFSSTSEIEESLETNIQNWYTTFPIKIRKFIGIKPTTLYCGSYPRIILEHCEHFLIGDTSKWPLMGSVFDMDIVISDFLPEDMFVAVEMDGEAMKGFKVGKII